jgi:hypothetical protein
VLVAWNHDGAAGADLIIVTNLDTFASTSPIDASGMIGTVTKGIQATGAATTSEASLAIVGAGSTSGVTIIYTEDTAGPDGYSLMGRDDSPDHAAARVILEGAGVTFSETPAGTPAAMTIGESTGKTIEYITSTAEIGDWEAPTTLVIEKSGTYTDAGFVRKIGVGA